MKFSKNISAVLLIIMASTSIIEAQKHFKVIEASSMSWSGGMAQSGSGTTYSIKAVLTTKQKVTFDGIWIGKEYGLLETHSFSYTDGRTLGKGDTVLLTYTINRYPPNSPMAQMANPINKPVPIYYKGEALIGFTIDNVTRYRSVAKFEQQPHQNYP